MKIILKVSKRLHWALGRKVVMETRISLPVLWCCANMYGHLCHH